MAAPTDIRIEVLGPVRIRGTARSVSPKQTLLLGALALRPGGLSTDAIIDLLWGHDEPVDPRAALQVHVSKLRRPLGEVGASVMFQNDRYRLVVDRDHLDVRCFERLVDRGTAALSTDPRSARRMLSTALEMWQGEPLGGAAEDTSLHVEVQRLRDIRVSAVGARIEADLALGRHAEVVAELRQLTRAFPLHEGFRRQSMLALYRSGRAGEALSAFEEARAVVADELGADPAPELRELHGRILRQDPDLATSGAAPDTRPPVADADVDPTSVAVLPFEVLGGDQDAAVLAAGLHIDVLTQLSRIPGLTVIDRHSVLPYDQRGQAPTTVARELGVAVVLTGTIRTSGRRFRLSVQLVDGDGGSHRWAESYDDELSPHNLLAVQHDLAGDIAGALSTRLVTGATPSTQSMEAYRLVVEGRMHFDRKTEDGFATALESFRRAVVADPDYGSAWTGLASTLALTADYGYGDRTALLASAESAAVRALAMVPDTSEVHEVLGLVAEVRHDAPRALAEYERAIRISPGQADAHSWHAWVSLVLGDADTALESARRAVQLNPLSAEAVSNLALALVSVGQPDAALTEARRSEALSPGYTTATYYAGLALYELRRFGEAVAVLTPLAASDTGDLSTPWAGMAPDAALAISLASLGDHAGAHETLQTIDADAYPVEAGLVAAALDDAALAYEHFDTTTRVGFGGAMLFHLHFRDVWATLDDRRRLAALGAHIARSWNATDERG